MNFDVDLNLDGVATFDVDLSTNLPTSSSFAIARACPEILSPPIPLPLPLPLPLPILSSSEGEAGNGGGRGSGSGKWHRSEAQGTQAPELFIFRASSSFDQRPKPERRPWVM